VKSALKISAALLLAILCGVAYAQDPLAAAVKSISNAGVFAFGGVGFIGKTSQGELDFRVIESQPSAVALADFEKVYAEGGAASKSYALVAIRQLDRTRSNELLRSLKGSQDKVFIMQGCILQTENLGDIAKAISQGSYDGYWRSR
jgi:hypothetical protein